MKTAKTNTVGWLRFHISYCQKKTAVFLYDWSIFLACIVFV